MIGDKSTYSMYFFNIIFFIANTITGDNMKVRLCSNFKGIRRCNDIKNYYLY